MGKRATAMDDRQCVMPIDLPPGPRLSSDEGARNDLLAMIETLEQSKTHPWSTRLLGWQLRRFATLKQLLTPIEAAALTDRFQSELDRLGPPSD